MDAQVQELIDRFAILDVVAKMNRTVDDKDFDGYIALYAPDGVFEAPGLFKVTGPDEIRAMVSALPPGHIHMTLDSIVEIDGDTARHSATSVFSWHNKAGTDFGLAGTGRYVDIFVRTGEGWRCARREALLDVDGATFMTNLGRGAV